MCGTCVCGGGDTTLLDSRPRSHIWKKVINVNAICYCHIILDVANVWDAKMLAVPTTAAAALKPHSLCSFSRIKSCFTMKNWACSESVVVDWCMNNNKCRFASFSFEPNSTACVLYIWARCRWASCVCVALLCFFVVGAFVFISHYWPSLRWVTTAAVRMKNEVISIEWGWFSEYTSSEQERMKRNSFFVCMWWICRTDTNVNSICNHILAIFRHRHAHTHMHTNTHTLMKWQLSNIIPPPPRKKNFRRTFSASRSILKI